MNMPRSFTSKPIARFVNLAVVISPINRKGGVGKSSSVFHLSGYFASQGMKVLCIDNEPQHSLSKGFFGPETADAYEAETTTAALFDASMKASPEKLIRRTPIENIDLVCGSNALDQFNGPVNPGNLKNQLVVKKFVDQVKQRYGIVLIDSPPNLQLCTYSSLAASTFTYCITMPQEFDVQGLKEVQKAIDAVLRTTNPTLRFTGYVLNMVKAKRSLHASYEQLLRSTYGEKVFETTVPDWNYFAESLSARQPISFYRPSSGANKVIRKLADELFERSLELWRQPPEFQYNDLEDLQRVSSQAFNEEVTP